jgi:hypothetical protein
MAITFIEKRKRSRYLVFVFLAILVAIIIILLWPNISGYLFEIESEILPPLEKTERKIEIDFEVFGHPLLEKLKLFPEIEPFAEEVGRENPFIFY